MAKLLTTFMLIIACATMIYFYCSKQVLATSNDNNTTWNIVPTSPCILIKDNKNYIPIEPISQLLKVKIVRQNDGWVTYINNGLSLAVKINSRIVQINGKKTRVEASPILYNNATYIPISVLTRIGWKIKRVDDKKLVMTVPGSKISFIIPDRKAEENADCVTAEYIPGYNEMELYLLNIYNGNIQRLTYNSEYDNYPSFSSNGHYLVVERKGCIFIRENDSPNERMILSSKIMDERFIYPSISPDAKYVFALKVTPSRKDNSWISHLVKVSIGGGGYTTIADASSYCISPDGKHIAIEDVNLDSGRKPVIKLLDVDGKSLREIGVGSNPIFSSDGNMIAFRKELHNGSISVVTYMLNGPNAETLYQPDIADSYNVDLAFSINDTCDKICYAKINGTYIQDGDVKKNEGIYISNIDRSDVTQIWNGQCISSMAYIDKDNLLFINKSTLCKLNIGNRKVSTVNNNIKLSKGFILTPDKRSILFIASPGDVCAK